MQRWLLATLALLGVAAYVSADTGYVVIRVNLDKTDAAPGDTTTGPGRPPAGGNTGTPGVPGYPGMPRPGGPGPGAGNIGTPPNPGYPGAPGGMTPPGYPGGSSGPRPGFPGGSTPPPGGNIGTPPPNPGYPGAPGGSTPPGYPGAPGGSGPRPGIPGAGMTGIPPNPGYPGAPGGSTPPGYPGGSTPPGGNIGTPPPNPGYPGAPGGSTPPGYPGGSTPPGYPGAGMGGMPSYPGMPGGSGPRPGGGILGGFGGLGVLGGIGGFVPAEPRFVMACIEVKGSKAVEAGGGLMITHKYAPPGETYGHTNIYSNNSDVIVVPVLSPATGKPLLPVSRQFADKQKALVAGNRTPEKALELARWALANGLVTECEQVMDSIGKDIEEKKAKVSNPVSEAWTNFKKVKAELDKPLPPLAEAELRPLRRYAPRDMQGDHYTVLSGDNQRQADLRLKVLEESCRAFYYWFALSEGGRALPTPTKRLLAVQLDKPEEFRKMRDAFEEDTPSAEGFLSRRDNVAYFSAARLDASSLMFDRMIQGMRQANWQPDDLLKERPTQPNAKAKAGEDHKTVRERTARAQTLFLLEKALDEQALRASTGYEAARQLLAVTNLSRPNVEMPQWLRYGVPAVFTTPRGPYKGLNGTPQVAEWATFGAPNWDHFRQFTRLRLEKQLGKPEEELKRVVTDSYFRTDRPATTVVLDTKGGIGLPGIGDDAVDAPSGITSAAGPSDRARTMAWALTFYLARHRQLGLMNIYKEFADLPRDLDLDEDLVRLRFARALDLLNETGDRVSEEKWTNFALGWFSAMELETPPGGEVVAEHVEKHNPSTPSTPTLPGFPGGFPQPGGPGTPGGFPQPGGPGAPGGFPQPGAPGGFPQPGAPGGFPQPGGPGGIRPGAN